MNGRTLMELRIQNGYTRKQLAEEIYVTEYIIQSWEHGWYIEPPSSGEIEDMAVAFHMSENEFRRIIEQDEDNDYDEDSVQTLGSFTSKLLDAAVRSAQFIDENHQAIRKQKRHPFKSWLCKLFK